MSRGPGHENDSDRVMHAWQRLHFALGAAGIGTWHLDLRTGVATYDESLNRIFGLPAVETQTPLAERLTSIHPDDRQRVTDAIDAAIAQRAEFTLEFRVVRPDGSIRWLRDRGRVVVDDDATPLVATGAVMDITERHKLEEHDHMLADVTQAFASAVDYDRTLASVASSLVPRFAATCCVHLRDDDDIRVVTCAGEARLVPPDSQVAGVIDTSTAVTGRHVLILPLRGRANAFGA